MTKTDQHEALEVAVKEFTSLRHPAGHGQPLEPAHQQPAADGKLCEKHMENPEPTDEHAGHGRAEFIDWIIIVDK